MKNNTKVIFILIIVIIIVISIVIFLNRKITIKESSLSEIFKTENFEDIDIAFVGVLGNELASIDTVEEKIKFLDTIENEQIQPTFLNDRTVVGDSYRFIIKYREKEYRLIVSGGTVTIKNKIYKTSGNIYQKLYSIFNDKYKDILA